MNEDGFTNSECENMLLLEIQPRLETPATTKQITIGGKRLASALRAQEFTKPNVNRAILGWLTEFSLRVRPKYHLSV